MDFEDIESVFPYVEMAHDYGYGDLDKDQGYSPRAYKLHTWYPHCPKGAGKYIFVLRWVSVGVIVVTCSFLHLTHRKISCCSLIKSLGSWPMQTKSCMDARNAL